MSRIELRGIIVSSSYDADWANGYIEKGQIMPESRFRSMLAKADKTQPLDLYVNSPGGSVFAGCEMINALHAWKQETGQKVNMVVGSLAASMAACMLVQAADSVAVHQNSKIMFHGANTMTEGGSEAHGDSAVLLDKINADIKALLVGKYKVAPETVAEWFAEGRAGWLSADDAVKIGLAQSKIGQDAEKMKISKAAQSALKERGSMLALVMEKEIDVEPEAQIPVQTSVAEVPKTEQPKQPETLVVVVAPEIEKLSAQVKHWQTTHDKLSGEFSKVKESHSKMIEQLEAEHKTKLDEMTKSVSEKEKTFSDLQTNLTKEQEKAKELEARLNKLTVQALGAEPEGSAATPSTWAEALQACGGDFKKACDKYPALRQKTLGKKIAK